LPHAEVAELVDAPDSKSGGGNLVWVRVPPSASLDHCGPRFRRTAHESVCYWSRVDVDIASVPRPDWSSLPAEGCIGVEGRVLVRETDFFIAVLRFRPHATIHEHAGANDTLVVCLEGGGITSVGGATTPLTEAERVIWPAGIPHRLWTEETTMTTLMVERPGIGFPARGLAERVG
jgi:quercetin dioxygenase-like cupin family protein